MVGLPEHKWWDYPSMSANVCDMLLISEALQLPSAGEVESVHISRCVDNDGHFHFDLSLFVFFMNVHRLG